MNRETERRFAELPEMNRPRSKFLRPFTHKTTFNAGDIIPIYLDQDILPGDTVSMKMASIVRMSTPLFPTMDNAALDVMFFFIPNRLVWAHWKQFWGENDSPWYQQIEYEIPQIMTKEGATFQENSLADYFGLPLDIEGLSVSALPFRSYCKVWDDWFRDENLQYVSFNTTADSDQYTNPLFASQGGALLKANKIHDYFTSALPAPQKGNEVNIPLGSLAPIVTGDEIPYTLQEQTGLQMRKVGGTGMGSTAMNLVIHPTATDYNLGNIEGSTSSIGTATGEYFYPSNLWVDLNGATAASITQLRQAFAIQRFYEAQARGGWAKA